MKTRCRSYRHNQRNFLEQYLGVSTENHNRMMSIERDDGTHTVLHGLAPSVLSLSDNDREVWGLGAVASDVPAILFIAICKDMSTLHFIHIIEYMYMSSIFHLTYCVQAIQAVTATRSSGLGCSIQLIHLYVNMRHTAFPPYDLQNANHSPNQQCPSLFIGHSFSDSQIIIEDGLERMSEPEVIDICGKMIFADMTSPLYKLNHSCEYFSEICRLLLVSNLLLWEQLTSNSNALVSTKDLYHCVVQQSHTAYILSADIYYEFTEGLLKVVINISPVWEESPKHLVSEVLTLLGASDKMLKTAHAVKDRNYVLLKGLKITLSR
ncbi:hypothetical protein STEG23_021140, partial [Scotinomys teguina]